MSKPNLSLVAAVIAGFTTLLLLLAGAPAADAFAAANQGTLRAMKISSLYASRVQAEDTIKDVVKKAFGIGMLASTLAFQAPSDASANYGALPTNSMELSHLVALHSSSIELADVIRTMDMTLPSYGSIADTQTTAGSLQSLSKEVGREGEDSSSGNLKSKRKATEAKQKVKVGKDKQTTTGIRQSLGGNISRKITGDPSDISASKGKTASAKKPIERQKVELEKNDPKVKIVDMGLPSYSETTTAKQRSPFSL